jgi:hypothetical protein
VSALRVRRRLRAAALLVAALPLAAAFGGSAQARSGAHGPAVQADVTGNATWFDGLGSPYGGCGMPQAQLETQDFVALNVFNTPGDASYNTRPVPPQDAAKMGAWQNGLNCGRWVRVKIGDFCTGVNDGQLGQAFCRGGTWTPDQYNDATLDMLVADSCADANAWCRDDPYHLDLSKGSLNRFVKNGVPVGDMYPGHWNNRHISWSYIPAPNYSGDIAIGFRMNAQRWWAAITVSHLPNGIHGVDYYDGTAWKAASMDHDMGQSYIIQPTVPGGTSYRIRVHDAGGALVQGGRTYSFDLPSACAGGGGCPTAYTAASYTTS